MSLSYKNCNFCGRNCGVDRSLTTGYCGMTDKLYVARAALHFWEEPIISGRNGSGTIFFSGCSMKCIYCQNREISRGESGIFISTERLSEIMLELQSKGANNINLVTPTHYAKTVIDAIELAKKNGLIIPIVYNTSGYDSLETLKSLKGSIDVYLADFKYYLNSTSSKYSSAFNYPETVKSAIDEMVRQTDVPVIDKNGILKKGTVVRILLLPSHVAEAKLIVKYLWDKYGDKIYLSLMSQYTPMENAPKPLDRRVTRSEYRELVEYAEKIGVTLGFTQDETSQSDSFIPAFDNTGVIK